MYSTLCGSTSLLLAPGPELLMRSPAEVKATETVGPVLVHIITQKGKGYLPAETASDKMHGVGPYNPKDGKSITKPSSKPKVRKRNTAKSPQ